MDMNVINIFSQLESSGEVLKTKLDKLSEVCEKLHKMNGEGRRIRQNFSTLIANSDEK